MTIIDKFHGISRLLAVVCLALAVSAPVAAGYVATGKSGAQTEQTGNQIDRTKKGDRLVSPQEKPVQDRAKQMPKNLQPARIMSA
jgi:hypothetical protein